MTRPPRRVSIIVNPIAGRGEGVRRARTVETALVTGGCEVEFFTTEAAGHAIELSREAAAHGADVVLICGGDGTVNEAVQGLAGKDTALAVMPLGTANLVSYELKLSRKPQRVINLVFHGRRRRLDVGRCGERMFLCVASVGFDAHVAERLAKLRTGAISYLSYARPMVEALRNYPFEPLRVRVDGRALAVPVYHVVIGNTRHYAGPFTMTPGARPDDGVLDAVGFAGRGKMWLMLYMAAAAVQLHHRIPNVCCVRGTRIEVEAERPVAVELDGDFKTYTPAVFEVLPQAITVLSGE